MMRALCLCLVLTSASAFSTAARELPQRTSPRRARAAVRLTLPLGARLPAETALKLGVSGRRAAVFFFNADEDSADVDLLQAAEEAVSKFAALGCDAIAVPQPSSGSGSQRFPSLTIVADTPFQADGKSTTLVKEFLVQPYATIAGPVPGRESFLIDGAGYVRGALVEQKDGAAHVAMALQGLTELEATPEVLLLEHQFKERAQVADDGVQLQRPSRPSAVGRMREKQAKEAAERGRGSGWDAELTKKMNEMASKFFS